MVTRKKKKCKNFQSIGINVDDSINKWNLLTKNKIGRVQKTDEFWSKVVEIVDVQNEPRYGNICKLPTALLYLPFSNASEERALSIANVVKNKLRNRMSIATLEAVMGVRFLILGRSKDFKILKDTVFSLFLNL